MTLRKSTRNWLILFAAALVALLVKPVSDRLGDARILVYLLANTAGAVLLWRTGVAAFALIVHRLTLRLAFSYFLIGIVPIPLLAALFFVFGYLLAHQFIATRLRSAVTEIVELASAAGANLPAVRIGGDDRVTESEVDWLKPGDGAAWARDLGEPHSLIALDRVWMGIGTKISGGTVVRLMPIGEPSAPWLQALADRTGFAVAVEVGRGERTRTGYEIRVENPKQRAANPDSALRFTEPRGASKPAGGLWTREWLGGVYLDRAIALVGRSPEESPVVAFLARTSPAVLVGQLFAQGVPEVRRVVRAVLVGLSGALLFVYLVALTIAFVLVGSIVRNVNRLTRATGAIAHGDFSVRVRSKSRDQIGDLARSFDGMAESIEKLLLKTARKEKLEAELAVARAVQESFLPESGGSWKGFRATAHFEPVADLGGDYYDILPMSDGRVAVSIGDVSGHGLPTALLAVSARATLASFLELGISAPESFARLERRTRRSRKPQRRLYTTLALFAYDAGRRVGTLTNAGHPAPYRISDGRVERLALPAFPIGLWPRSDVTYPSREFAFAPGDRLVLFTDGIVEAANANEDPFGYERSRRCSPGRAISRS